MVKGLGTMESAMDSGMIGSKDNKKDASELRCLIVNAIVSEADARPS